MKTYYNCTDKRHISSWNNKVAEGYECAKDIICSFKKYSYNHHKAELMGRAQDMTRDPIEQDALFEGMMNYLDGLYK